MKSAATGPIVSPRYEAVVTRLIASPLRSAGAQVGRDGQHRDRERSLARAGEEPDQDDERQRGLESEPEIARDHHHRADDDHHAPTAPVREAPHGRARQHRGDARRPDRDPDAEAPAIQLVAHVEREHEQDEPERRERAEGPEPNADERAGDHALRHKVTLEPAAELHAACGLTR